LGPVVSYGGEAIVSNGSCTHFVLETLVICLMVVICTSLVTTDARADTIDLFAVAEAGATRRADGSSDASESDAFADAAANLGSGNWIDSSILFNTEVRFGFHGVIDSEDPWGVGVVKNRTAFEVPLGAIPIGATITHALVAFRNDGPSDVEIALTGYTGNKASEVADAATLGSTTLSTSSPAEVSYNPVVVDVTAFIQTLYGSGESYAGFNISPTTPPTTAGRSYGAWDVSQSSPYPLVRVTYDPVAPVPEPATLALFGLGAAGLAVYRRRKMR